MAMWLNWHEGLKAFKKDLGEPEEVSRLQKNAFQAGHARADRRLAERRAREALQVVEAGRSGSESASQIPFDAKEIRTWEMPGFTVKEMTIQSTPGRRIEIVLTIAEEERRAAARGGVHRRAWLQQVQPPTPAARRSAHIPRTLRDGSPIYKSFGSELAKSYVTISTLVSQHNVYETGRTLMGERLWDLMRCVSYLESLPNVDKTRIGCGGLSLGGEMTMWLAAMDTRIAAADSSGWLTTMDQLESNHCLCWKFAGLRELVDWADVFSLIAPRPLECQNGRKESRLGFSSAACQEGAGRDPAGV